MIPPTELLLAVQWDSRDRWDFKRPRWEVDFLGGGNSSSQASAKDLVQRGRQYGTAGARRMFCKAELWEEIKRLWKGKQNGS